jgi:hypothetical protein
LFGSLLDAGVDSVEIKISPILGVRLLSTARHSHRLHLETQSALSSGIVAVNYTI